MDGQEAYEYIGALEERQFMYLLNQPTDRARKNKLFRWYGRNGSRYAWEQWLIWKRSHMTRAELSES